MPKVLIVDDALADRVLVSGIVSKWLDSTVFEAENGRLALAQIELHQPDMVLTDLHMPEMNGLELVTAVKGDFPHIPIILMTALGSEEIAAKALQSGAASYVPKRRLAEDLLDTLNRVHSRSLEERTQSALMHYLSHTDTTFALPNDLLLIRACVDQLLNMLRCIPLGDETERLRVGIALEEAIENAYYHGNLEVKTAPGATSARFNEIAAERRVEAPWCTRQIHVHTTIDRERAKFVIRDDGAGFDTSTLTDPGHVSASQLQRGRGITLMSSIMDEVTFNNTGNEVTLVRYHCSDDDGDFDDDDDVDEM